MFRRQLLLAVLFIPFFCSSLIAEQTPTVSQTPVQRDPQALTILAQALSAGGGEAALAAIQDFTAAGTVTYSWGGGVQGSAKVKGRGLHEFRVDATLADGLHSWIVNGSATFQRNPDGSTSTLPSQNTIKLAPVTFPLLHVLAVVQDTTFSISYNGLVTRNGQQLHDISVQKTFPPGVDPVGELGKITKLHIFIDPNALTVQTIEDTAYGKNGGPGTFSHELQFANYQPMNGVLVPFSVKEFVAGQQIMSLQLSGIKFNGGLTDSDFN